MKMGEIYKKMGGIYKKTMEFTKKNDKIHKKNCEKMDYIHGKKRRSLFFNLAPLARRMYKLKINITQSQKFHKR